MQVGDTTALPAGITGQTTEQWMVQIARNAIDETDGSLRGLRFALPDRDSKFCSSEFLIRGGVIPLRLPARSPNLNAFAATKCAGHFL